MRFDEDALSADAGCCDDDDVFDDVEDEANLD